MMTALRRYTILLGLSCMLLILHACATVTAPPPNGLKAKPETVQPAPTETAPKKAPAPKPAPDNLAGSKNAKPRILKVVATAYTSHPGQTDSTPDLAAWGDRLKPGMKCIAVSRDLIPMGLGHNTPVKIKGLPGVYLVKDKLNKRFKKRIDIYFGKDLKAARAWGKRNVEIEWGKHVVAKALYGVTGVEVAEAE